MLRLRGMGHKALETLREMQDVLPELMRHWEKGVPSLIPSALTPAPKRIEEADMTRIYEMRARRLSWGLGGTGYLGFFSSRPGIRHIFLSRLEAILNFTPPSPSATLDVGCGAGVITILLARLSKRAIGIDASNTAIEFARELARRLRVKNVEFREGNVESLKLDQRFDLIVCSEVIEHLSRPLLLLRDLHGLLRDDGVLILSTPCTFLPSRGEKHVDRMLYSATGKCYLRPHYRFNYGYLLRELKASGLNVEGTRGCALGFPAYPVLYYFVPNSIVPVLRRIEASLNEVNIMQRCAVTTCFKLTKQAT